MDNTETIAVLAALAQPTRLQAFRLLVEAEPEGIAAGELARRLDIPQNTMSAHLNTLTQAGIVTGLRQGRSIIYRANLERLRAAMLFLLRDCCGGNPDLCTPLIEDLAPCCETHPTEA
ncbi:helix-turn-helix transcriptional regulator [Martelella lutilitoris]|uniref:Helix-turn-helix transcriptional regulator n=1 Tax=Martelella lutilitoris TaxID=2583532 RepID=A0A5C4JVD0_9HYPH|nr:metalloregulator ArsR/SmtB family transcription factor [Martelella lutilitoris]TNB49184.1 helix-turn-helix transcriptional regulator [Martelella lutilitoris]